MSLSTLLLPEYDAEIATTRTVLERTPDADGAGEWKPHEKAFAMAHLAQLVAMLPSWTTLVLTTTEFDVAPKEKRPGGGYSIQPTAALLEQFEKNARDGRAALAAATDADMQVPWSLKAGGNVVATDSRYMTLRRTVINHLVHHRAQLALYLRIHGEKVPQMYGPTADEGWSAPGG